MKYQPENLRKAFNAASELIGKSDSLESAAPLLLETLARAFRCDWGTFWKVESDSMVLRPIATWSSPNVKTDNLAKDTTGRSLSLSEGTAGHVWRSRKPVWTVDLTKDMCIPRSLDAYSAGLTGGVWFALKTERAVYGVFEFLGTGLPKATEDLLVEVENLGVRLGTEIESHF